MDYVTIEDIVKYFENLAAKCKLIATFSTGENEDVSEGQENYPHLFLEQPFEIREVIGGSKIGDKSLVNYEVYRIIFKVLDRVEDKTQYTAITSKCKNIASYVVMQIQRDKFSPYAIEEVSHLTDTDTNDNSCTFDRVEFDLKFARWVNKCDLNTIFDA